MVLLVCLRLAWDLVATPEDLFTVMIGGGA
jgi:hypothetical protein